MRTLRPREIDSPEEEVRNVTQGFHDTGGEEVVTELVVTTQATEGLGGQLWADPVRVIPCLQSSPPVKRECH